MLLNAVEMELIWLGESMYSWCVLSFNLTSFTRYAPCTEAKLKALPGRPVRRKKLRQVARMDVGGYLDI
jgi:hypothetical protein